MVSGTLRSWRLSSHSGIPDYLTGPLAWIKTSSVLPVVCMERLQVLGDSPAHLSLSGTELFKNSMRLQLSDEQKCTWGFNVAGIA